MTCLLDWLFILTYSNHYSNNQYKRSADCLCWCMYIISHYTCIQGYSKWLSGF